VNVEGTGTEYGLKPCAGSLPLSGAMLVPCTRLRCVITQNTTVLPPARLLTDGETECLAVLNTDPEEGTGLLTRCVFLGIL
jgi:hypothetical protein